MKVSNSRDHIEFAPLSKLINKEKVRDIRNYNVEKIEEAVKNMDAACNEGEENLA